MIPRRIDPAGSPADTGDAPPEHEIKLVLGRERLPQVRRWLTGHCPAHPHYPASIVSSIYFDTPDWHSLGEKTNSDFLKTKLRLRWYSDVATGRPGAIVHLEAKLKRGSRRGKLRIPIDVTGPELSAAILGRERLPDVGSLLQAHGVVPPGLLQPALRIDYTRLRFVEPASRANLCLDYDIHVPRSNPRMVVRRDPGRLGQAVFEAKGRSAELARELRPLIRLGCRKASFSKYLECYRRLTDSVA